MCKGILSKIMLAIFVSLNLGLTPAFAANFGGTNVDNYNGNDNNGYIGVYQPSVGDVKGGNLTIDSNVGIASNRRNVIGGYSNNGNATYNSVVINGGTVYGAVYGGNSNNGNANYNSVVINGGTVSGNISGGYNVAGGNTSYNSVIINGGSVEKDVRGGNSSRGDATYNTVSIFGSPTFAATSQILGGFGGSGDFTTGNTLNFFTSGISITNIINFQHYNFALPTNGSTGLTLTDNTNFTFTFTSTINIPYAMSGNLLAVGDSATILTTSGLSNLPTLTNGQAKQGISLIYDYSLAQSGNTSIIATITGVSANPASKALTETRASAVAVVNTGADLAAGSGLANAVAAAGTTSTPFAGTAIGNMRYKTGSHVDSTGTSMLTGFAKKIGKTTLGYFIEGGWSSYDTFNSDNNNGQGHANYYGLGILAKKQLKNNLYIDTSLRLGQIKTGYSNQTQPKQTTLDKLASYHDTNTYYSAHLGLGKQYKLTNTSDIDIYARYLFSHQNSSNINILGDNFNFEALNSNRLQLGTKYTFGKTNNKNYYLGLTYEYEMSGTARASVYGYNLPSPSLKGSSGILEVGMQIKPSKDQNYTIDIGLQGYAGKRQGFSGSISANFNL